MINAIVTMEVSWAERGRSLEACVTKMGLIFEYNIL